MKKRGLIGKIILIVIIAILLVAGAAAFYFYNFHVFKTVRVCVGEVSDTGAPCENVQNCVDLAEENGMSVDLGDAPDFIRDNFDAILDEAVYCDGTCFVKEVRGIDPETQELEMLENCEDGEVEFAVDIRGKEGLEVLEWMKARNA